MVENKCVFCNREPIRERIIWENDLFYSLFDAYPVSPGHCLIIPKRHVTDMSFPKWETTRNLDKTLLHPPSVS